ncbi:MAG: 50S ribosomal protein L10 [Armatimonadetes bacterium]|nr:50S ribosomal protein L10 [Armatimonadota bacterium]
MPTPKKEAIVAEMEQALQDARGLIVVSFTGLSVPVLTGLRAKLREADARLVVAKNRLMKIVVGGTAAEQLVEHLAGPNAFVFCRSDVPPVAKALVEFQKDNPGIELRASYLEGAVYEQKRTQALATIPTKPELLAEMVGALESPLSGLVFTLQGIVNEFVYTLDAVADKRAAEAA